MWLREDGTPYYIGKGTGKRALVNGTHVTKKPLDPQKIILIWAESEKEALETEVALIWFYGRADLGLGCLYNLTDGGELPLNRSEVCRNKMRVAKLGKKRAPHSQATKEKMKYNNWQRGTVMLLCKRGHIRVTKSCKGKVTYHCQVCNLDKQRERRKASKLRANAHGRQ